MNVRQFRFINRVFGYSSIATETGTHTAKLCTKWEAPQVQFLVRLFSRPLTFQRQGHGPDSAENSLEVGVPVTCSDKFQQFVTDRAETRRFSAGAVFEQGS